MKLPEISGDQTVLAAFAAGIILTPIFFWLPFAYQIIARKVNAA